MRLRAAGALAALALLAAPACKPSSLTPGWIGERGPEAFGDTPVVAGLWEGTTSEGDSVRFQVAGGFVRDLVVWRVGTCPRIFANAIPEEIVGVTFAFTVELENGGFFSVDAAFPNAAAVAGSYSYSGIAIQEGCPRTGAGSFTAVPVQ
jgi:hypothetical protein